jgi:prepilin-type N-terminal cleavage/methylation domain-containing protein
MRIQSYPNRKGITLIELLVALVICGIVVAGIYRVFVAQTKAYTIQDQVVEVQQNVRSAMEILLRDLRMAGYDDDDPSSLIITAPIVRPVGQDSIKVNYEKYNTETIPEQYETHRVDYWLDGGTQLKRQRHVNGVAGSSDIVLENVDAFNITYGVDVNEDGAMDDQNGDGIIDENDWVPFATVNGLGNPRIIALRVILTARPDQTNPDVKEMVSPRSLESIVTLRNLNLIR